MLVSLNDEMPRNAWTCVHARRCCRSREACPGRALTARCFLLPLLLLLLLPLPPFLLLPPFCIPVRCSRQRQRDQETGKVTLHTCSLFPVQDMDKLQPGAFYLDRQPHSKHLPLSGTKYTSADVDRLWEALEKLAAPALPSA